MARKSSHVHKLRKHKYTTGNAVFFCLLPDCHFKIDAPLALGKRAICNICEEEFIMTEYTVKLDKPHCSNCGKVKVKDAEGKTRYVRKVSNKVLAGVASEVNEGLRMRLESATSPPGEDDI